MALDEGVLRLIPWVGDARESSTRTARKHPKGQHILWQLGTLPDQGQWHWFRAFNQISEQGRGREGREEVF